MKSLKENFQKAHIVIIGSGIIGKFNALELSELGFPHSYYWIRDYWKI